MSPSLFIETVNKIGIQVRLSGINVFFIDGNGLELLSISVDIFNDSDCLTNLFIELLDIRINGGQNNVNE